MLGDFYIQILYLMMKGSRDRRCSTLITVFNWQGDIKSRVEWECYLHSRWWDDEHVGIRMLIIIRSEKRVQIGKWSVAGFSKNFVGSPNWQRIL